MSLFSGIAQNNLVESKGTDGQLTEQNDGQQQQSPLLPLPLLPLPYSSFYSSYPSYPYPYPS